MSKPVVLYGMDISPPVRSCLLTLKTLDIPYEYKIVNLFAQEHLTEEFLKHNPQHTVPVLEDNGNWIWDSHAICAYLVSKYGKDDKLYPKDLVKRAVVDQRMYFEASVLFSALRNVSMPMFRSNVNIVPKEKTDNILEGYDFVEKFLGENPFIAGETLTIADFCYAATLSSLPGVVDIDAEKYPKIIAWFKRLEQLPYYEELNVKGAKEYIEIIKSRLIEIHL